MAITKDQQQAVLAAARALIGKPYDQMDCSHFVHQAFATASLAYPYTNTAGFPGLITKGQDFFEVAGADSMQAGDVVMFAKHMGIWDPQGCTVLAAAQSPNNECTKFTNAAPVLSSRSGGNRGPDFGTTSMFGEIKAVYRWKGIDSSKPKETKETL